MVNMGDDAEVADIIHKVIVISSLGLSSLKCDERLSAIKMLIALYLARRGDPLIIARTMGSSRPSTLDSLISVQSFALPVVNSVLYWGLGMTLFYFLLKRSSSIPTNLPKTK